MTCVFECFQSHCHILKELHEFFGLMGAIIIFRNSIAIYSFVVIVSPLIILKNKIGESFG
jgi:hypothetical protein